MCRNIEQHTTWKPSQKTDEKYSQFLANVRDLQVSFQLTRVMAPRGHAEFAEDGCRDYAGRAFSHRLRRPTDAVAQKIQFTQSAPLAPGQVKLHFERKTKLSDFHNSKVVLDANKQPTVV